MSSEAKQTVKICGLCLLGFLALRYLLLLTMPFLLGTAVALAAEPVVALLGRKAHFPRAAAAGVGVGLSFLLLGAALTLLCGIALRELGALAGILPDMETRIQGGLQTAWDYLLELCGHAPPGIREALTQSTNRLFTDSSAVVDKGVGYVLRMASGILSRMPGSMLALGTCILSSFMISAKLPKIRQALSRRTARFASLRPVLQRMKKALLGWLTAQCKLSGLTFLLTCAGLLLLKVPYAPVWAVLIALVDAFPVLGTGTVLIPWSFISFLQADRLRAFGLLGLYALCALARSALEPRLVGKQLGLDPLVTLFSLYAGFRLWGLVGMLAAPILAVTAVQVFREGFPPPA